MTLQSGQQALVEQHLEFALRLARSLVARYHCQEHLEDCEQEARIGLMEAAETYDPTRDTTFETWAFYPIRRYIVAFLRTHLRRGSDEARRALTEQLENELLEIEAGSAEQARTPEQVYRAFQRGMSKLVCTHALSELATGSDDDGAAHDPASSHPDADRVDRTTEQEATRQRVTSAIEMLPDRQADIVRLYFIEERTIPECAKIIGINKGNVSRQLKNALVTLNEVLDEP